MNTRPSAISYREPFIRRMEETILEHGMLAKNASVLAGVSGGADSVALLFGLHRLAAVYNWRLGVAHVNHGLRGEAADHDAQFTAALARRLGLSYYEKELDLYAESDPRGANLEEAARNARYAFLYKTADLFGFDRIAVGHNRDDAAEQMLINLLRGAGPAGLGGLAPVCSRVIRPLSDIPRREIERFLCKHSLSHCTDETNQDLRFTRNRIRNRLIPALEKYNPEIAAALSRTARLMREENEWIESLLEPVFTQAKTRDDRTHGMLDLSADELLSLPRAAGRRIVRRAVSEVKGDLRRISNRHIEKVLALAGKRPEGGQIHLPGRVRVTCSRDAVRFVREKKSLRSSAHSGRQWESIAFARTIGRPPKTPESLWIDEIRARMVFQPSTFHDIRDIKEIFKDTNPDTAWMDLDGVDFPLTVRNPRPGDRFIPLGMGGSVKIKNFFINNKVPAPDRPRIPLVESAGRIIWVGGMRIAEGVGITDTTKRVLKITLLWNQTDQRLAEEQTIERV